MKLPDFIHTPAYEPAKPQDAQSFAAHYKDVANYVASLLGSGQDIYDVVQDTFLRVFKHRDPAAIRSPKSFLIKTASNLVIDRRRKQQTRERYLSEVEDLEIFPDPRATPCEDEIARERRAFVEQVMASLPPKCREVFILSCYGGFSQPEIAERLGISRHTVKKHVLRAMVSYREAMRAMDEQATAEKPSF